MKTKLTATVIALLAGTIAVSAQQQRRQGPQQGSGARFGNQPPACPECGSVQRGNRGPNTFQKRRGPQAGHNRQFNQWQQGPRQRQFQGNAPQCFQNNGPQRRPQARNQQFAPQQQRQAQKKRQAIMKRFDLDNDGQLSDSERQALKREMKNRRGDNQNPRRPQKPKAPPAEESVE